MQVPNTQEQDTVYTSKLFISVMMRLTAMLLHIKYIFLFLKKSFFKEQYILIIAILFIIVCKYCLFEYTDNKETIPKYFQKYQRNAKNRLTVSSFPQNITTLFPLKSLKTKKQPLIGLKSRTCFHDMIIFILVT